MEREQEFRDWLQSGGANTQPGRNSRVYAVKTIERNLAALGSPYPDLARAFAADRFASLRERLREIRAQAKAGGDSYRILMPDSERPLGRLSNWNSWLAQYGRFLAGESRAQAVDREALDWLKARFLEAFPDFEASGAFEGRSEYHRLEDDYKRALVGEVQSLLAGDQAADPEVLGGAILDQLTGRTSNLLGYYKTGQRIGAIRQAHPGELETHVGRLATSTADPAEAAEAFLEPAWPLLAEGSESSFPYGESRILSTVVQALARPEEAIAVIYQRFHNLGEALLKRPIFGNNPLKAAEYRVVIELAQEIWRVMDEEWHWKPRDLWDVQGFVWVTCGEKLDGDGQADAIRRWVLDKIINPARRRGEASVSVVAGNVNREMGLSKAWPNICSALGGRKFQELASVPPPTVAGPAQSTTTTFTFTLSQDDRTMQPPSNLILYGPPGTGKTYATPRHAVTLCDGSAPADRDAVMARYRELERQRRIAFVTFHQSYDYENFVEGLRPETGGAEAESAGFRLEPVPGVFREICALADQARTRQNPRPGNSAIDLAGRRFWKMAQGAIGTEDDVYEAALAGSYVTLGWGGANDWSDDRFETMDAVRTEWLSRNPDDRTPSNWTQVHPFRTEMRKGDIVIVPYGNSAFRAVAEIVGDYRYEPAAEGYYAHRRDVRWLLTLDEPLPLDTIVEGKFTMRTLYSIAAKRVNVEALSRLLSSEDDNQPEESSGEGPDQFVLIIDEINRANISKVFGELITLIETDKRLGMPGELRLTLPYSKKRDFGVPANLHIIGTMNTADRSIALLDTALRRRFQFHELAPDPSRLPELVDGVPLRRVLEVMNDRIEYLVDRDHRIGHAFFMGPGGDSRAAIDATMRDKVIPLLQEYFFDDWSRLAAVLGASQVRAGGFLECRILKDPTGNEGQDRQSWRVRNAFTADAYDQLIGRDAEAADPPAEIGGAAP